MTDISGWPKAQLLAWLRRRGFMATMSETRATLRGYVEGCLEADAQLEQERLEREEREAVARGTPLVKLRARFAPGLLLDGCRCRSYHQRTGLHASGCPLYVPEPLPTEMAREVFGGWVALHASVAQGHEWSLTVGRKGFKLLELDVDVDARTIRFATGVESRLNADMVGLIHAHGVLLTKGDMLEEWIVGQLGASELAVTTTTTDITIHHPDIGMVP